MVKINSCTNVYAYEAFLSILYYMYAAPIMHLDPSSLLIPVNSEAVFMCEAHCTTSCTMHWLIGNTAVINEHQMRGHENLSFVFKSHQNQTQDGLIVHSLQLTINTTVKVNNTRLCCVAALGGLNTLSTKSAPAVLQVIQGN